MSCIFLEWGSLLFITRSNTKMSILDIDIYGVSLILYIDPGLMV